MKIRMTVLGGFACLDGMGQHSDRLKRTFLRCLAASLAKGPADIIYMIIHALEADFECKQVAQSAFVLIELDYMPVTGQEIQHKTKQADSCIDALVGLRLLCPSGDRELGSARRYLTDGPECLYLCQIFRSASRALCRC